MPFVVRGGGWSPDIFLHYSAADTAKQIALMKNMGLNTVRLEGHLMPQDWYNQMDAAGIMINAGFQCCDAWELQSSGLTSSADYAIMTNSAVAIAQNLRNHPSVSSFQWSDQPPLATQETDTLNAFSQQDFTVPVISSAEYNSSPTLGISGEKEGPYDWVPPNYWYDTTHFDKNDSTQTNAGGSWGYDSEQSAGDTVPTMDSLNRFMSSSDLSNLWQSPTANQYHANYETACNNNYSFGRFSDRRVPFDASELVFCVTDMSVTLTGRPGGSADESSGQAVLLPCSDRIVSMRLGGELLPYPCGWSAITIASDAPGCLDGEAAPPCWICRKPTTTGQSERGISFRSRLHGCPKSSARDLGVARSRLGSCTLLVICVILPFGCCAACEGFLRWKHGREARWRGDARSCWRSVLLSSRWRRRWRTRWRRRRWETVSASVIAATAVAALTVPLWPGRTDGPEPGDDAVATETGGAKATSGGDANTGGSKAWNPNQVSENSRFVTAMLKNNDTTQMALKGANAQMSGTRANSTAARCPADGT